MDSAVGGRAGGVARASPASGGGADGTCGVRACGVADSSTHSARVLRWSGEREGSGWRAALLPRGLRTKLAAGAWAKGFLQLLPTEQLVALQAVSGDRYLWSPAGLATKKGASLRAA